MQLDGLYLTSQPELFIRVVKPEAPHSTVVFFHASMVHSEYYMPFAIALGHLGYQVYLPDLQGHGRSGGRRGHVSSPATAISDIDRVMNEVQQRSHQRIIIAGESYGALLAYLWIRYGQTSNIPIHASLLVSPAFRLQREVTRWERRAIRALYRVWPTFVSPVPASVAGLSAHPFGEKILNADRMLCRQYSIGFFDVLLQMQDSLRAPWPYRGGPLLTMLADHDAIVDVDFARQILRTQVPDCEIVTVPHTLHSVVGASPQTVAEMFHRWISSKVQNIGQSQDI